MASLRQLEYFVAVVEEASFTRAAERLHVTQPALSHQVRALEQAVGCPLLERLPRTVRPTAAGRAFLPDACAAVADAGRAVSAARRVAGLAQGELHVATTYSVGLGVLPGVLRAWRREHPGVRVRLAEFRHADGLAEAMAAGGADVAVGPVPEGWAGPVHPLGDEAFVVVVPADDPAAAGGATTVALADLADRDWVHYAPGNGLADLVDQAAAAQGFRPRAAVRTEQSAAAPVLAAAGLGPALVPANIVPAGYDGAVLRPDPPVRRPLAAWARTDPGPAAVAFAEVAVRTAEV
jgi:DNA-binding transcriptional LysR family regulator